MEKREEGESTDGLQSYKTKFIRYWAFLPAHYHATELGWLPMRNRSWGHGDSRSICHWQRAAPQICYSCARRMQPDIYIQCTRSWRGTRDKGRMQRPGHATTFRNATSFTTTEKAFLQIPQETSFPFGGPRYLSRPPIAVQLIIVFQIYYHSKLIQIQLWEEAEEISRGDLNKQGLWTEQSLFEVCACPHNQLQTFSFKQTKKPQTPPRYLYVLPYFIPPYLIAEMLFWHQLQFCPHTL